MARSQIHPTLRPRSRARSVAAAAIATATAVITAVALDGSDVGAASFVVTNLAASGEGSLSDRIADANAAAGPDVITFAPGLSGTIAHLGTALVTDDLTIVGPGPDQITLTSAGGTGLHADQADLHLSGITIGATVGRGVLVTSTDEASISNVRFVGSGTGGDAVLAATTVDAITVSDVTVDRAPASGISLVNMAEAHVERVDVTDAGTGILVSFVGTFTATDVTVTEPATNGISMIDDGDVHLERVDVVDSLNRGILARRTGETTFIDVDASGSDIENITIEDSDGPITLTDVTADGSLDGVGLEILDIEGDVTVAGLSAIDNDNANIEIVDVGGDVTLTDVTAADSGNEGIIVTSVDGDVTLERTTSTGHGRVGTRVSSSGHTSLTDVTSSRNRVGFEIDGATVDVDTATAVDNDLEGIFVELADVIDIADSYVEGGTAGIVVEEFGAATVERSTVTETQREGIDVRNGDRLDVRNSSIVETAVGTGQAIQEAPAAIAIDIDGVAETAIDHTTIADEPGSAGIAFAPLIEHEVGGITIGNSILTATATDVIGPPGFRVGPITIEHNLVPPTHPAAGVNGNVGVDDPVLSGLGDHGGPTPTMRPLLGSPAIDAGNPAFTAALDETDQRGGARVVGDRTDIGAVEVDGGVVDVSPASLSVAEGTTASVQVTRSGAGDGAATVQVTAVAGSAATADFVPISTTLVWADGETGSRTVPVTALADTADEQPETFTIVLSGPSGVSLGVSTRLVTVTDVLTVPAIVPVEPRRFLDTRPESTVDGQFAGVGRRPTGDVVRVPIAGRGDVPVDAVGVVANLTVILPSAPGHATMFPCTDDVPLASHANYVAGDIVANNTVVPLNDAGEVCVFTLAATDLAIDVNGYVPAGSPLGLVAPARYLDTRPEPTFDGAASGGGRIADGGVVEVPIAGRGTVPADATAAIVNVTLIAADGPGHVTLFPCGDRPEASTLNYAAGEVVPNGAIVALSNTGSLCVSTHRSADIVLDVSGFVPAGVPTLATSTPARFLDTRGDGTVDGESNGGGAVPGGHQVEIRVAGRSGVPADATAAILNVTIIAPHAAAGHVTVHPCGELPVASNLNHTQSGVVRANNAVTKLSERGTVCVFTVAEADFVVDVNGWLRG